MTLEKTEQETNSYDVIISPADRVLITEEDLRVTSGYREVHKELASSSMSRPDQRSLQRLVPKSLA